MGGELWSPEMGDALERALLGGFGEVDGLPGPTGDATPGLVVWAIAIFLGLARAAACFAVTPFLSYLGLKGVMRVAVAGAIAAPVFLGLPNALMIEQLDALTLMALIVKEALVGVALGLLLGLPFWAVEMAGAAIDQQRMAVSAVMTAPDGRTEVSVLGLFLGLLYVAYLFAVDGHLALFEVLYVSYDLWPALSLTPGELPQAERALTFLQDLMALALLLGGPILFLLLLSDLGIAAMARFAPQMNAMMLAMQVKSLLISVALLLYLGVLFSAFDGQYRYFLDLRSALGEGR